MPENTEKSLKKFSCEKCDYYTDSNKDFSKHIFTAKHLKTIEINGFQQEIPKNPSVKSYQCENCNKSYKERSGLWRHRKICVTKVLDLSEEEDKEKEEEIKLIKEMMLQMMKQNHDLQNTVLEICKNGTYQNSNNNNTNNSHNKTFNLQFFLNETCKDAMNLTDFVDSIQMQLSDLEKVGKLGYVKGISDIIIHNLNQLDETERPVHCSDHKRETIYVKDENEWHKEEPQKHKLKKAITKVANKNIKMIPQWKAKYPDCVFSDSRKSDQYNHIIYESMDVNEENHEKIIKNIAKNVMINK